MMMMIITIKFFFFLKALIPLFKYLRGEVFSDKHWLELFMILEMENKSPETLILGDFLTVKDKIIMSSQSLQVIIYIFTRI